MPLLLLSSLLLGHCIIAGLDCVRVDRIRQRSESSCIMPPKDVFGEPDAEAVTCDVADRVITNNKSIQDEEDPGIGSLDLCSLPGLRSIVLLCILIFNSLYQKVPGLIARRQPKQKSDSNVAERAAIPLLTRPSRNSTGIRRGAYLIGFVRG